MHVVTAFLLHSRDVLNITMYNCHNYKYFLPIGTETLSMSNFLEEPSSVYAALGDKAVFRCQHSTAEIIEWNINGTLVNQFHVLLNISLSNDTAITPDRVVHTLTIEALEVYNNTNVSCVAGFFNSQHPVERTPNASIVIQGVNNTTMIHDYVQLL